jgi:hypothetical protein
VPVSLQRVSGVHDDMETPFVRCPSPSRERLTPKTRTSGAKQTILRRSSAGEQQVGAVIAESSAELNGLRPGEAAVADHRAERGGDRSVFGHVQVGTPSGW